MKLSIFTHLLTTMAAALSAKKKLVVDTDLFSDVDDAGALLLAATAPHVELLAVNVNYPSRYSAVAASAILAHYGRGATPVGIRRPLTDAKFFDTMKYALGEYCSKVAYRWSGGTVPWGRADDAAWDPVALYRKVLAAAPDRSVTIASIGFLENLSGLLSSTADRYSDLDGPALIERKVAELVVMGGVFPEGRSYNFWGSDPKAAAHVVNNWKGRMVFAGNDVGREVLSGMPLMKEGPEDDPVRKAYIYYSGLSPRSSWDPLAVLYAMNGLGELFKFGNDTGYNRVSPDDGTNRWVEDGKPHNQFYLRMKADKDTAAAELDRLYLQGARSVLGRSATKEQQVVDTGKDRKEL
ncbi:inosine/uridine-preferring nucleoside hydrolase [Xylariomycetidae sp. FL0641]|nr:inosine/uridine-preferring nucleoside hydrolase [Xylariomycetidae sp. FL0641]